MKTLIKLALAALVTYAAWNAGNAWLSFVKLKDAIFEDAQYGAKLSDEELKAKVLETASQHGTTLDDDLTIRRSNPHTFVDASYTEPVNLLPWYVYPWRFEIHVDVLTLQGLK